MTDTWDGRPENPERDGTHWIIGRTGIAFAAEWDATTGDWAWVGGDERGWIYAGPCLTPAEVAARVDAARREGIEAAADETWRIAQGLSPNGITYEAGYANGALDCERVIRALLEDGR